MKIFACMPGNADLIFLLKQNFSIIQMTKIFLMGSESINSEIRELLNGKAEFTPGWGLCIE